MVIDDDNRDLLPQPIEGLEELFDHRWRKALKRLVQQKNPDVAGKRASHGHHLLLTTGEIICRAIQPLLDSRKILVDAFAGPVDTVAGLPFQPAELKILIDAHAGEQAAALRHISDAEPRVLGR